MLSQLPGTYVSDPLKMTVTSAGSGAPREPEREEAECSGKRKRSADDDSLPCERKRASVRLVRKVQTLITAWLTPRAS